MGADRTESTQVAIIGAGPAGLVLAKLLEREGIESVVLERRSREYVEGRIRAGVLEQGTADLLRELGVASRMEREGLAHDGVKFRFAGRDHHLDFPSRTGGRRIMVYGQQEVVKDLIDDRLAVGGEVRFEAPVLEVEGLSSDRPSVTYLAEDGGKARLNCDFVAGCDGFHGISRRSVPPGVLTEFEHVYPYSWLGVLAEAEPFSEELVYAHHLEGFALHSMRSPTLSRNYVQVGNEESLEEWSDERFWQAFERRMSKGGGAGVSRGRVIEKSIAHMRSFVVEPMQYGRLFLAGDAAHIVPATGAKGLNLAVSDVRVLAGALAEHYASGSAAGLESYSRRCLRKVWRAQHFSWFMTSTLHRTEGDSEFSFKLQEAQLAYLFESEAAATSLAENYVGWIDPQLGF